MKYEVREIGYVEGDDLNNHTRFDTLDEAIAYIKKDHDAIESDIQNLKDGTELDFNFKQNLVIDGINTKFYHFWEGDMEGDSEITYTITLITDEQLDIELVEIENNIRLAKIKIDEEEKAKNKFDPKLVTAKIINDMSDEELYRYFGSSFKYEGARAVIRANFKTLEYSIIKNQDSDSDEDDMVAAYNRSTPENNEVIICVFGPTFYWTKTK